MGQFLHCKIKPISDEQFNEMGIFSEHSIQILKKQPVLGVKERRTQKNGTLVYLCGGEVGDSMMLWVWEQFVEYHQGGTDESAREQRTN